MKPDDGDDPTLTPDQVATQPAARESEPVLVQDLPGYQLGDVIGRGGMGEVVTALDVQFGREVALKRMRATRPTGDMIKRFIREAKVQARLDHPAIVPVHELGTDGAGNPYFTMKRLVGTTLQQAIEQGRPLTALLRAFVDVCFAIQLAHEREIVHRDLKPSNVMLGNYNDVYVIDWGVARVLDQRRTSSMYAAVVDTLSPDDGGTQTGALLGTPGYMAPEQMKGDDVTPAADVFSLGSILFEILAGEPLHPVGREAITSTLAKAGDSPARRKPQRTIAPELDAVCVAALAEDPNARPTARELAERIQRYLDGDRDLERRRLVAAEQLALAREALADPLRHSEAGQAASRALALDPESTEAAQLVTQMVLEPPSQIPPELAASLHAEEMVLNRQRGRSAMFAFLSIFLFLPVFVFLQKIKNWPELIALYGAALAMALLSWHNSRTGRAPAWLLMLGNFTLAFLFSRLSSTFVLTVGLVCGQTLALATREGIAKRPALLVGWIAVTLLAPVTLEWFGLIEPTWHMSPRGLVSHGAILDTVREVDVLALAAGQVALACVVGIFAMATTRAREDAQRRAHIQAWQLQQLIPRAARRNESRLASG
ncbi:MAG TPA: serine/threonine-protein kinase [Kofleriaceae bacterium]